MKKLPKGWFEIFRGGKQRDSTGTEVDGDGLIDKILSKFDADGTEAELVVGHPDDDAPGFGKIADIKEYLRDGIRVLIAKPTEVVESFAKQVSKNWFPGRSIGVDGDGTLLHVGFLPQGVPPAVKGMLPAQFSEQGGKVFFSEFEGNQDLFEKLTNWFKQEFKGLSGEDYLPEQEVEEGESMKFTEEEVQAREKAATDKATKDAKAEAKKEFAEQKEKEDKKTSDKGVEDWVKGKVKDGVILPALVDGGLVAFMQCLDIKDKHEFSDGEERTPLEFAKEMLEFLGDKGKIKTGEFARKDNAPPESGKISPEAEVAAAHAFMATEEKTGRFIGIDVALTEIRRAREAGGE